MPASASDNTNPGGSDHSGQARTWIDRFGGKLVLVLLDNKFGPSLKGERSQWGVQRPLSYRPFDMTFEIIVPAGFPTDLASVPRWAWVIVPPDGPWVKAAVIHDFLYATSGTGVYWAKHPAGITRSQPYSRWEADLILREAMENRGVGPFKRNIIYWAVRMGGGKWWADKDQGRAPTAPGEDFISD